MRVIRDEYNKFNSANGETEVLDSTSNGFHPAAIAGIAVAATTAVGGLGLGIRHWLKNRKEEDPKSKKSKKE